MLYFLIFFGGGGVRMKKKLEKKQEIKSFLFEFLFLGTNFDWLMSYCINNISIESINIGSKTRLDWRPFLIVKKIDSNKHSYTLS